MAFFADAAKRIQSNIPAGASEQGGFTGGQSGDLRAQIQPYTPQQSQQIADMQGSFSPQGGANFAPAVGGGGGAPQGGGSVHDSTQGGMSREQYRDAWQGSGATSMADLQAFTQAHGGTINSGNGTVTTPYGEQIDMLQGARAGAGNGKAAWGGVGGGSGGSGGGGGSLSAMMPSQAPGGMGGGMGGGGGYGGGGGSSSSNFSASGGAWDGQKYTATPLTYGGDYNPTNIATPAALQAERFNAPADFRATTAEDMKVDPGYNFRLQQGADALQASKAASGMLRSGNTLTALNDYAQGAASQEFGNVDSRRKNEYQNAFNNALSTNQTNNKNNSDAYGLTNQYQGAANQFNAGRVDNAHQNNFANKYTIDNANNANAQNAWSGNVNAQLGVGNLALGNKSADNSYGVGMANVGLGYHNANQSYDLGLKNNALGYTQAANSYSLGQGNLGLGWANQGLAADNQNFNQGFSLAGMGMQGAQQSGQWGGQYGANAQNNAGNAGMAQAGGTMGAGNAYGNFAQGAGGTLTDMAAYYANKNGGGQYGGGGSGGAIR